MEVALGVGDALDNGVEGDVAVSAELAAMLELKPGLGDAALGDAVKAGALACDVGDVFDDAAGTLHVVALDCCLVGDLPAGGEDAAGVFRNLNAEGADAGKAGGAGVGDG